MNALLLVVVLSQNVPKTPDPECKTSGTQQDCGYHCRAELGEVRCARTPEGFCTRIAGQLACWDPPEEVRLHGAGKATATCSAKRSDVACGFACLDSPSNQACTQTPWGACVTRFDSVACWDPSPAVVHTFYPDLGGAKCLSTDLAWACGWDCKQSYQEVACAQTPTGRCMVIKGKISCVDAPVMSPSHAPVTTTK